MAIMNADVDREIGRESFECRLDVGVRPFDIVYIGR